MLNPARVPRLDRADLPGMSPDEVDELNDLIQARHLAAEQETHDTQVRFLERVRRDAVEACGVAFVSGDDAIRHARMTGTDLHDVLNKVAPDDAEVYDQRNKQLVWAAVIDAAWRPEPGFEDDPDRFGMRCCDECLKPAWPSQIVGGDCSTCGTQFPVRIVLPDTHVVDEERNAGSMPRDAVEAATDDVPVDGDVSGTDADYEFARPSAIGNAGEDIRDSARHRRNRWTTLADAEANGTAKELVTRKELLRNEPLTLPVTDYPMTALAMHFGMNAFPAEPGVSTRRYGWNITEEQKAKDRSDFLDVYRDLSRYATNLSQTEPDPLRAADWFGKKIRETIDARRKTNSYDVIANDLIKTYRAVRASTAANSAQQKVRDVRKLWTESLKTRFPDSTEEQVREWAQSQEGVNDLAGRVQAVLDGKSVPVAFDSSTKRQEGFSDSEQYVTVATRTGGRDLTGLVDDTPEAYVQYIQDTYRFRGLQWGNSVTDAERGHHSKRLAEAFADLEDVTGLAPDTISLRNELGIAIGARGRGGALAHYEPETKALNLTRKKGVGSLAHEWAHGLDFMFWDGTVWQGGRGKETKRFTLADESDQTHTFTEPDRFSGKVRTQTCNASQAEARRVSGKPVEERRDIRVRKAMQALQAAQEPFRVRCRENVRKLQSMGLMDFKRGQYYMDEKEMFARTTESHVQHVLQSEGRENTYLAGGTNTMLWPDVSEREAMVPAYKELFAAIKEHEQNRAERP